MVNRRRFSRAQLPRRVLLTAVVTVRGVVISCASDTGSNWNCAAPSRYDPRWITNPSRRWTSRTWAPRSGARARSPRARRRWRRGRRRTWGRRRPTNPAAPLPPSPVGSLARSSSLTMFSVALTHPLDLTRRDRLLLGSLWFIFSGGDADFSTFLPFHVCLNFPCHMVSLEANFLVSSYIKICNFYHQLLLVANTPKYYRELLWNKRC